MFCARVKNKRGRAFTLLEIMLAVWIIGLVGIGMFRFVDGNMQAIRISTGKSARAESIRAISRVMQRQLNELSPLLQGALLGEAHTFQNMASDELSWKCQAGNGLFTENAAGEYLVTLAVRRDTAARTSSLSLRRVSDRENEKSEAGWFDLMANVDGVEFRYFDSRQNSWVDRWNDQGVRPSLVRMRIWRDKDPVPYEAILSVPPTQPPITG